MKIIILAAGRGQRYREAGFDIPKPLINFKQKPFVLHAIEQFEVDEDIIVVGTPEVCDYVRTRRRDMKVVVVEQTQRGPAMSALLAGGYIKDDEPVVIMDSDGIFDNQMAQRFVKEMFFTKASVGVMFTEREGDNSPYCNLTIDGEMKPAGSLRTRIDSVGEKTGGSRYIAVGGYGFSKWEEFRGVAMYKATEPSDTEIYISSIIQYYIEKKFGVAGMYVPPELWTSLGTPAELDFAERNL